MYAVLAYISNSLYALHCKMDLLAWYLNRVHPFNMTNCLAKSKTPSCVGALHGDCNDEVANSNQRDGDDNDKGGDDVLVEVTKEVFQQRYLEDSLEASLVAEVDRADEVLNEYVQHMEMAPVWIRSKLTFEPLDTLTSSTKPPKSCIEEPPTLELKLLPNYLRYAFIGDNSNLPIIIS
ncbi:hypothetical protein ACH5RR_037044 [Cinchona calisaya]|uniref:Uncharacterized protein n=1 Tax=Cinchona calisaya TaxID=153742 RepID=A0ABD2Y6I8_9GENT